MKWNCKDLKAIISGQLSSKVFNMRWCIIYVGVPFGLVEVSMASNGESFD